MTDRAMVSIVGMDLGTSNSAVGIQKNGRVRVLECEGFSAIPSYVSFSNEDVVDVGRTALRGAAYKHMNTIYDIKRMIGRQFRDTFIQEQMKYWPFKLAEGKNGEILIVLDFEGRKRVMNPEEIAAKIILKMRDLASDHFNNRPVTSAVVAIPTYFNEELCNATYRAAKMAGVDIIELIPEPMAAALAYAERTSNYTGYNLLVFDLGGGTFDVRIVTLVNDAIDTLMVDGDLNLGGRDFDNILFNICVAKIKETLGCHVDSNQKQKLRYKCDGMKRKLTNQPEIRFNTREIFTDFKNVPLVITRDNFEQESQHLVDRCIEITKNILYSTRLKPDDIQHILLVGGSSKIPSIRRKLFEMFGRDKIYPLEDAVAYGSAVRAAQIYEEMKLSNSNRVENVASSASTSVQAARNNSTGNGFQNDAIVLDNSPLEYSSSERPANVHSPEPANFALSRESMSEKDNAQAQIIELTKINEFLNQQLFRSQAKVDHLERESDFQKSEVLNRCELLTQAKFRVEAAKKRAEQLENDNGALNTELATAKQEIAKFCHRIREATEVSENLVNRLNASKTQCSEFEAKIAYLNDALGKMSNEREENAGDISRLQLRFDALQAKNNELEQEARENKRLVIEVYSLRKALDSAQNEVKTANKANENITERLYNLNNKLYTDNAKVSELEALAETERAENAEKMSHLQRRLEALQAENSELAHRAKETEQLMTEVCSLTKLLDGKQNEAKQLTEENSSLREQITQYEVKFEESNAQKQKAEEEIATLYARIKEVNKLNENVVEHLNTSLVKCTDELTTAKEELVTEREKNADERSQFQLRLNALEAENKVRVRRSNEANFILISEVDSLKDLLTTAQNEHKLLSDENALLREKMAQYKDAQQATDEQYKETLKERERKVTDLEQNLKHSEQLNAEISEELVKSNMNLDQIKKSNESLTEERSQFQLRLNASEAENKERVRRSNEANFILISEVDSVKDLLTTAQNEHKLLSDENALLREKMAQYKDALQATDEQYKMTLKERERKVTDLEQNLKHSEQLNAEISEELVKSNMNLDQVRKSNESLTEELKATKDKNSELETQSVQLTSQIVNERAQNSKESSCLQLRLRMLEAKNIEYEHDNKAILELTLNIDILKTQLSNTESQAKELSDRNASLRTQVMQYKSQFNRSDAQLIKLQGEYTSLLNMSRQVERHLSLKRKQLAHLREQATDYRDTLEQRESKIFELDKNIQQSEQIRSSLSEELDKSNSEIKSVKIKLERQQSENKQCTSVWNQQHNADQMRICNLESKLAQTKILLSDIAEEVKKTEPTFHLEPIRLPAASWEYEARKRHSLDNDEENQDLRDSIKKPYLSPIPPDDLSRLPTPSNCEDALSNHGEHDTTLPLLQPPIPAHENVALSDVGANGEITAQVFRSERST